jgi:23S rRNA pseudouridine1911/1915/1917 synthase
VADPLTLIVPESLDESRLDKALATILEISRAAARVLVDQGVTVNGEPARSSDRVGAGATLVTPPPATEAGLIAEEVPFEVAYEDPSFLVVDKPAGITVHPGSGRSQGTLAAGLLHRYPELEGVGQAGRWGLVHRLDKETSGTMIVARTTPAFDALTSALARHEIERIYLAVAHGRFAAPTGTIDAPIGPDPGRPTRRALSPTGKPAVTHYEVLEELGEASLLEVRLETGRTHQIRVHLAAIEHPVLGDRTYSPQPAVRRAPRVMLHARFVEFDHPVTRERLAVEAPVPQDMEEVIAGLRRSGS